MKFLIENGLNESFIQLQYENNLKIRGFKKQISWLAEFPFIIFLFNKTHEQIHSQFICNLS